MRIYFILFLLLLKPALAFPQLKREANAFQLTDSVSRTISYNGDLKELVYNLTKGSKTEIQKTRAIFIWVTHNISYDYKGYNRHKKPKFPKCKNGNDCSAKYISWENKYLEKVLSKRQAVCEGYARLFSRMCGLAGIQSAVVPGYVKMKPQHIGKMGPLDHAWNAVLIDGEYYFLDPTWAAGGCTKNKKGKLDGFVRDFDEYYWFTPIDKLSRNHFPKDSILPATSYVERKIYRDQPYIKDKLLSRLNILEPSSGIIDVRLGDTIRFSIEYSGSVDKMQLNTNLLRNPGIWKVENGLKIVDERALGRQKYISYRQEGNLYYFEYVVRKNNLAFIEVLFDHELSLKFKVKTKK